MSVRWESILIKLTHRKTHRRRRGNDKKNFVNRQSSTNRMLKRKLQLRKSHAKKQQQSLETNLKPKND